MKKIILPILLMWCISTVSAQSLDDIKELLGKNNFDTIKAKDLVDKHLANPKNATKADGWYYKGYVYNLLANSNKLNTSCQDCRLDAFNAYKKYQELDKKNVLLLLQQNAPFFDMYNKYFDAGAKAFNTKDYAIAGTSFKNALQVEDYVREKGFDYNGYKFPVLDTILIVNTALAARLNKNDEEAIKYYKILADNKVASPQYLEMYQYIASYYMGKKDQQNFAAAIEQGKKLYPQESYWTSLEMENINSTAKNKEELFTKYDELVQKNPTDYTLAYNYAVEMYNHLYASDAKGIKTNTDKDKMEKVISNAIAIKSTADDNLLMGRFLYNSAYDLIDDAKKIKGTKPEDIKKRKIANDASIIQMSKCIPYCEKANEIFAAMSALKPVDKANYKQSLSMLQGIYTVKKDLAKAAACTKKMASL